MRIRAQTNNGQGGVIDNLGRQKCAPIGEGHVVRVLIEADIVVRQVIILDQMAHSTPKFLERRLRSRLLQQRIKTNRPACLTPAVFARDLIDPPFDGFAQTEIVLVKGEDLLRLDRIEDPV